MESLMMIHDGDGDGSQIPIPTPEEAPFEHCYWMRGATFAENINNSSISIVKELN
jgi:hypothetical protein